MGPGLCGRHEAGLGGETEHSLLGVGYAGRILPLCGVRRRFPIKVCSAERGALVHYPLGFIQALFYLPGSCVRENRLSKNKVEFAAENAKPELHIVIEYWSFYPELIAPNLSLYTLVKQPSVRFQTEIVSW